MIPKEIKINLLAKKWNNLIERELGRKIDDTELSALSSWVVDCYESYNEIYGNHLEKIQNAPLDDHELIHDCIVDIYWQLNHIKMHIEASEKGFASLMRKLAKENGDDVFNPG
jgi:hypothetical protein